MKRANEEYGECRFCNIINSKEPDYKVFENDISLAFLDKRPLFIGHTLLVPKKHIETLYDMPNEIIGGLFSDVKFVAKGVELAMHADGTFIAINNRVSQSVPHLHVHIVPRKYNERLKGFFWPRTEYKNENEATKVMDSIKKELALLKKQE